MRTLDHAGQTERQRLKAMRLSRAGWSAARIGRLLNVDPRTVRRWRSAYRRNGHAGLLTKQAPGKPCRLSKRQRHGLTRRLLGGAKRQGFFSDLWTCPRIVQLIQQHHGVTYHLDHIPRLMRRLGFSVQKPERQARERDEQAIQHWIDHDWKRIKKRLLPVEEH